MARTRKEAVEIRGVSVTLAGVTLWNFEKLDAVKELDPNPHVTLERAVSNIFFPLLLEI